MTAVDSCPSCERPVLMGELSCSKCSGTPLWAFLVCSLILGAVLWLGCRLAYVRGFKAADAAAGALLERELLPLLDQYKQRHIGDLRTAMDAAVVVSEALAEERALRENLEQRLRNARVHPLPLAHPEAVSVVQRMPVGGTGWIRVQDIVSLVSPTGSPRSNAYAVKFHAPVSPRQGTSWCVEVYRAESEWTVTVHGESPDSFPPAVSGLPVTLSVCGCVTEEAPCVNR